MGDSYEKFSIVKFSAVVYFDNGQLLSRVINPVSDAPISDPDSPHTLLTLDLQTSWGTRIRT